MKSYLHKKVDAFQASHELKALGIYPYFRAIDSDQETEVLMKGKRVLMFGSNSYLGLTSHPKVKEAAKLAGYPDAEVEVLMYEEKAFTGLVYPTEKYYPTWKIPEDSVYLKDASIAYEKTLNRKPEIGKWTFSTNGIAIAGMNGIPCIGLGPGNEVLAHMPDENSPVKHLSECAAVYAALVYKMNNK